MEENKTTEKEEKNKEENSVSDSDNDSDVDPELDNIVEKINQNPEKKKMSLIPRSGVSAEVYGTFHKKESFVPKKIPKTDEQMQRINKKR